MKSAIVMYADSPSLLQLAGELNSFLQHNTIDMAPTELWIFYQQTKPQTIAEINLPITNVEFIHASSHYLPEALLSQLQQLQQQKQCDLILFFGDSLSAELATRLAFRSHGSSCINVEHLSIEDQQLHVSKAVYGNNLTATFSLCHKPYCLSIARQATKPAETSTTNYPANEFITLETEQGNWVKDVTITPVSHNDEGKNANFVLAIGRGVNYNAIGEMQNIAKKLGAYFAASRPVTMNGWVEISRMVGVSGLKLSPKICIVAGASGAAAFIEGIRNSEFIIAINNDPNAAIFNIADVAIIDDLVPVLTELARLISDNN